MRKENYPSENLSEKATLIDLFVLEKDELLEGILKLDKKGEVQEGILILDKEGKAPVVSPKEVYLFGTSIKPDFGDGELLVTFPSLRAVKRQPINDEATVVISTVDAPILEKKHPGVYAVVEKPPSFTLAVLAGVINSDEKGCGRLVINIKKAPDSDTFPAYVSLKIAGADFKDVGDANFDPPDIRLKPDPTKDQDPAFWEL